MFVLVALSTTSISLGAFLFQHMWDTKPETVVASVVASGVLLVAFGLQVVRRFVAYVGLRTMAALPQRAAC